MPVRRTRNNRRFGLKLGRAVAIASALSLLLSARVLAAAGNASPSGAPGLKERLENLYKLLHRGSPNELPTPTLVAGSRGLEKPVTPGGHGHSDGQKDESKVDKKTEHADEAKVDHEGVARNEKGEGQDEKDEAQDKHAEEKDKPANLTVALADETAKSSSHRKKQGDRRHG